MTYSSATTQGASRQTAPSAPAVLHAAGDYFETPDGQAVYLAGNHTWTDGQNVGSIPFDFDAYLNLLQSEGANFIRLWNEGSPVFGNAGLGPVSPLPFARTADGKFDLDTFNQTYFDDLRSKVLAADAKGIYVSIMLFNGWSVRQNSLAEDPWQANPFNAANNINGINGDPNNTGTGVDTQTLHNPSVWAIQQAYIAKVIQTVSDLPNVLFEVSNESTGSDADYAWQNAVVEYIHSTEASDGGLQHPVGMSAFDFWNASGQWSSQEYGNSQLFQSDADWVSPAGSDQYQNNPPDAPGNKVVIADTDHTFGIGGNADWVWQQFTRGNNVASMDDLSGTGIAGTVPSATSAQIIDETSDRLGITETRQVSTIVDLMGMTPSNSLSSTGYALADPATGNYVVYAPSGGTFTVDLSATAGQALDAQWMDVGSGEMSAPTNLAGGSGQQTFSAPDDDSVLVLTPKASADGLCFCRGTRIATPRGERAVEELRVGDMVLTMQGDAMPIRWIGTACRLLAAGAGMEENPVVVHVGALADGMPVRDLRLTKGHSLFIDGVLIPVESLVNGRSIAFEHRPQLVELFHLELDRHEVLIADGTPAESYRDDGNGVRFRNRRPNGPPGRPPCAPILASGSMVDRIWRRIADRAGITPGVTTSETDLHLLADGRRVDARMVAGGLHLFRLECRPPSLRIVSRSGVPCALGVNADRRRLGVALARVVLRGTGITRELGPDAPELGEGFHRPEPNLRWTDGDAVMPSALFDGFAGTLNVELHLADTATYPA